MSARTLRRTGLSPSYLLLMGVGVAWGTIGVAAELVQRESGLDPFMVNWLRTVIAAPVLLALAGRESGRAALSASRRDTALMVTLGVVVIVTNLLYLVAVDRAGGWRRRRWSRSASRRSSSSPSPPRFWGSA